MTGTAQGRAALDQAQLMLALAQARLRRAEAIEAHQAELEAGLRQAAADRDAVHRQAMAAEATLATIQASTSWRVMQAMQRAGRLLGREPAAHSGAQPVSAAAPAAEPAIATPSGPEPEPDDEGVLAVAYAAFLRSGHRLVFPRPAEPDVAVVIVAVPDDPALLLACLQSVLAQSGPAFEVALSNPGGAAAELLARTEGLVAAPGRAAALLLLDGSLLLRPGALDAALAALHPDVGAVAGRVVLPTGLVEQAGGVLWRDGTTAAYGAGLPDGHAEVMFARDADHAGGGLMLTTRTAFEQAGGLGSDAAFGAALRAAGLRVAYAPRLAADRFGPPQPPVADAAQRRQALALRDVASGRLPPHPGNLLHARDPSGRLRLLVLDGFMPMAVMGAGYPRARAVLNEASALGWAVTLFPMERGDAVWAATYDSLAEEIEVCGGRGAAELAEFLRERAGFYDALLVSRPEYMRALRATLAADPGRLGAMRLIYDAEALFSTRDLQRRRLEGKPAAAAEADALVADELRLLDGVDAVMAVTASEAAVFAGGQAAPVHVVSHPLDVAVGVAGFAARAGFLFVGRLLEVQSPNYDGLAWFVGKVWPRIRAALPDATLTVIGAVIAEPTALQADGVALLGPVADLAPHYAAARVFVAPTRFAAGIPIKVLEAGAAGVPVAATALVASQLGWTDGGEIVAVDEPAALAARAVALYEDPGLWSRTRLAAAARLADEHGPERFRDALRAALGGDGGPPRPARRTGARSLGSPPAAC